MIIGIDYRFAIKSIRGIGYYTKSIVDELTILDQQNLYYLYVDQDVEIKLPPNFKLVVIHCKNLLLFEQYELPKRAKRDGVECLWYPSNSGPIFLDKHIKLIVTIHDLVSFNRRLSINLLIHPRKLKFALGEKYRGLALKFGLKRIDHLIAVSNYSGHQIFRQLNRKATVIPNHVHVLTPAIEPAAMMAKFGITAKKYFYTLAGSAPHKNLQAYIYLFKDGKFDFPLVIGGITDPTVIGKYQSKNIIFSGYVTDDEKATLYAHAIAFLFLSLDEGFGLPIIEAMQFGIPIIASNRGALPEVLGDAGVLVDPHNLTQIEKELMKITASTDLETQTKQQRQARKFMNWQQAAQAHLAIFLNPDPTT